MHHLPLKSSNCHQNRFDQLVLGTKRFQSNSKEAKIALIWRNCPLFAKSKSVCIKLIDWVKSFRKKSFLNVVPIHGGQTKFQQFTGATKTKQPLIIAQIFFYCKKEVALSPYGSLAIFDDSLLGVKNWEVGATYGCSFSGDFKFNVEVPQGFTGFIQDPEATYLIKGKEIKMDYNSTFVDGNFWKEISCLSIF